MAEALGLAVNCLTVVDLAAKVASKLYDYGRDVARARDDVQAIRDRVLRLEKVGRSVHILLQRHGDACDIPTLNMLRDGIFRTEEKLLQVHKSLDIGEGGKAMRKLGLRSLKWPFQSRDVQRIVSDLQTCFEILSQSLQVDQVSLLLDMNRGALFDRLPHSEDAAYDSRAEAQNPTCHPSTRSGVLSDIRTWAADSDGKNIFWLNGMAGTGKSTISRTVAQFLAQENALAGSFFFKRGESNRGNCNLFFSTISFQLACKEPSFESSLKEALNSDPSLLEKSLADQFNQILIQPLSSIPPHMRRTKSIVIVVDALDECDNDRDIQTLIYLLSSAKWLPHPWRIKTFITSRPELPIRLGFGAVRGTFQDLILHDVPTDIVGNDIFVFLEHELTNIRVGYNHSVPPSRHLPGHWPGQASIRLITDMATPLFIVAATVCRFVADRRSGSPREQLAKIVNYRHPTEASKLAAIYLPILHQTMTGLSPTEHRIALSDFHAIVGSIILAYEPLSSSALAMLLQLSEERVAGRLDLLHSCLHVPPDPMLPVRFLHLSFRDFLTDPDGCDQSPFWVHGKEEHMRIAKRCLDTMERLLVYNICKAPWAPRTNLTSGIEYFQWEDYIPRELVYSCKYWVDHLAAAGACLNDDHPVHSFLRRHLLHWIEVICIIGTVPKLLVSLRTLTKLVQMCNAEGMKELLEDALNVVTANMQMIIKWPLQLYSSALLFAPVNSIIRRTFPHQLPCRVDVKTKLKSDWDPLRTVFRHEREFILVKALAWSHDDQYIAILFSAEDNHTQDKPVEQVEVWDLASGGERLAIRAAGKTQIAFSHDSGLFAAFGGHELTIYRSGTGAVVQHITTFGPWTFAQDVPVLVTMTEEGDLVLWEATLEANISYFVQKRVLTSSSISISCMKLCKGMLTVASTYENYQVELWRFPADSATPMPIRNPRCWAQCPVRSRFSKTRSILCHKVEIFRATDSELLQTFESDSSTWSAISFSPDSQLVARDSGRGTIEIRGSTNGNSVMSLGQQGASAIAFSYESAQLAVAHYGSINIWTIARGHTKDRHGAKAHLEPISWIKLSPNSSVLAVGMTEGDIQIWDPTKGECMLILRGHKSAAGSYVFSTNSRLLASYCDTDLRIWDLATAECLYQQQVDSRWSTDLKTISHMSLIGGLPSIVLDPGLPGKEPYLGELLTEEVARFADYALVFGCVEYAPDTSDLLFSQPMSVGHLSSIEAWRVRVVRFIEGRWIQRGHTEEFNHHPVSKLSKDGEVLINVEVSSNKIIVQHLASCQILLSSTVFSNEIILSGLEIRESLDSSKSCTCPQFVVIGQIYAGGFWCTVDVCTCDLEFSDIAGQCTQPAALTSHRGTKYDKPWATLWWSTEAAGMCSTLMLGQTGLFHFPPGYLVKESDYGEITPDSSQVVVAIATESGEVVCMNIIFDQGKG